MGVKSPVFESWFCTYCVILGKSLHISEPQIGMEDEENVLIANPAGKKRLNIVSLEEMINYMWSCTDEPDGFYWNGKKRCGGYIKVLL